MKTQNSIFRIGLLLMLATLMVPAYSAPADIYIVYIGKGKKIQQMVKKSLPSEFNVKSYNASILAKADYSGKQKAVSKLSSAKLIVFVSTKPFALLGKPKLKNTVTINNGGAADIVLIIAAMPK